MSFRPITRRALATGATAAAGVAIMRNLILARDTPEATPAADPAPQLLIRIESLGSMLPAAPFTTVPEFSLFDDGAIYSLGPQLAIFPPPALPNLVFTRINEAAVQKLVAAARTAGLDQPRELVASVSLADAPTTIITFFDGEEFVTSSASGLLILTEPPDDWDDETWEAFVQIRSIVSLLLGFSTQIEASEIIEPERSIAPERLQVIAYPADHAFAGMSSIPNLEQPALTWPLLPALAEIAAKTDEENLLDSGCVEINGDDVQTIVEVVLEGDLMSPWVDPADDTVQYGVLFRPLLPDQSACDD